MRPSSAPAVLLAASLVFIPPAVARATAPIDIAAQMQRARLAEQQLDYDVAAELWLEIVASGELSSSQRLEANLSAGRVARIRGQDAEARMYFYYVLKRHPEFELPADTPPKVANFFELVRQELRAAADDSPEQPSPPPQEPDTRARESGGPAAADVLLVGASAICALTGAAAVAGGAFAGAQFQQAEQAALATDEQLDRAARYDERDQLALLANLGLGAGALLLAGGAGLAAAWLLLEDD